MKTSILLAGAALAFASAAQADTLFSNPYDGSGNGDCSWSTTCAATVGRGDDFAAQEFTLTHAAIVTGGAFEEVPGASSGDVTAVTWGLVLADGPGGLPGTILATGEDSVLSYGTGSNGSLEGFFDVGPQYLAAGTYYFALQGVSGQLTEYLGEGMLGSGAANTQDGGVTWQSGYYCGGDGDCMPSVAVSLFGTSLGVPEPATWALMLVGFGGLGGALRRRDKAAA